MRDGLLRPRWRVPRQTAILPRTWMPIAVAAQTYVVAVIVFLVAWEVSSRAYGIPLLVPPVEVTFRKLVHLVKQGLLLRDILWTTGRVAVGFFIGSVAGATAGLAMGYWPIIRRMLEPYVNFFRFIPALAWISIVLLLLGTGEVARISIIVYTSVSAVLINTLAGIVSIPPAQLRAAQTFGANQSQIFSRVIFPGTVRYILTGMRLALGSAFMAVISAEMLVADQGLGFLVINARLWMAMDEALVGVIFIGLLGLLADRLFGYLVNRYAWRFYGGTGSEM